MSDGCLLIDYGSNLDARTMKVLLTLPLTAHLYWTLSVAPEPTLPLPSKSVMVTISEAGRPPAVALTAAAEKVKLSPSYTAGMSGNCTTIAGILSNPGTLKLLQVTVRVFVERLKSTV